MLVAIRSLRLGALALAALSIALPIGGIPAHAKQAPGVQWEAAGTLLEACSCSVPCPCNFGQGPSRDYCHTIYAYRLKEAVYDGIRLDGLCFGGGEGSAGIMGFLDDRASSAQRPALEKLAIAVFKFGGASMGKRAFQFVRLAAVSTTTSFSVSFGENGGFAANVLIGRDGKKPIVVENNTTWPVDRFSKGKTSKFEYHDSAGNRMSFEGVNANLGEFKLSSGPKPAPHPGTTASTEANPGSGR